jgi:hypothetical protein
VRCNNTAGFSAILSGIMENISDNPPPKKRGRPRKAQPWEWALVVNTSGKSHRHKAGAIYEARALSSVMDDPRFEWLWSDGATIKQGKGHMRHTILTELGRIDDEEEREAMALYLCAHQPTTRQAVALIRQYRLGTRPPGSIGQLADVISRAVATYQAEHVPLSADDVYQALHAVAHEVLMASRAAEP